MFENRQYQSNCIEDIITAVSAKRKALLQLATGGGKTYIFSLICQRFTRNTDQSVLILVHREELMYQAAKTIEEVMCIKPHLITAKTKHFRVSRVYIGMVESTTKRLNFFDNVGLVIIDECHIANFNKVHNIFLEELIIGVTATPISSSKKNPLNNFYNDIVVGPSIKELISLGYLCQNITRSPKDVIDATKLEISRITGDFDEAKMAEIYKKPHNVINTLEVYLRHCKGKKTIVFNVNKEHSKEVTKIFCLAGVNCRHLDSDSEDRQKVLEWFKDTEDAVLCNVMIATVGFDEPTIQRVINNFSTLSLVKWIQTAGRGGRPISEEKAIELHCYPKSTFEIIDMGGNATRFGDWCDDRDWKRLFDFPDEPSDGVAPTKICPSCQGLIHASLHICPLQTDGEFCGYVFDRKKKDEEKALSEMIVITKGIDLDELIERNKNKYNMYTFFQLAEEVVSGIYNKLRITNKTILDRGFSEYYNMCIDWAMKTNNIDISNSQWHINRAKREYDICIEKYAEKSKDLPMVCHVCGADAELHCEECDYPTCENCSVDCVCTQCSNVIA